MINKKNGIFLLFSLFSTLCVYAGGDSDDDSIDTLNNSSTLLGKRTQSQTQTNLEQAQSGLISSQNKKRESKSNDKTNLNIVLQADEISDKQQVKAEVKGEPNLRAVTFFYEMNHRNINAAIQTASKYSLSFVNNENIHMPLLVFNNEKTVKSTQTKVVLKIEDEE